MMKLVRLPAIAVLVVLTGCSSAPPANLYTIDPPLIPSGSCSASATTLEVLPVMLPEYADRDQLIHRSATHEIVLDEADHWAERPSTGIARSLAARLAARPDLCSALAPQPGARDLLVVSFDVFEIAADGSPNIAGSWLVRPRDDDTPQYSGRFDKRGDPSTSVAGSVVGMNGLVTALADEISASIRPAR
jgi:uncharacterized lipoprotein YmbA